MALTPHQRLFLQERSLQKVTAGQMQKSTDRGMPTPIYTLTTQPPHLMLRKDYGKGEGRFYRPEGEEIWGGWGIKSLPLKHTEDTVYGGRGINMIMIQCMEGIP